MVAPTGCSKANLVAPAGVRTALSFLLLAGLFSQRNTGVFVRRPKKSIDHKPNIQSDRISPPTGCSKVRVVAPAWCCSQLATTGRIASGVSSPRSEVSVSKLQELYSSRSNNTPPSAPRFRSHGSLGLLTPSSPAHPPASHQYSDST